MGIQGKDKGKNTVPTLRGSNLENQLDIQVKPEKRKIETELWFIREPNAGFRYRFEIHHQRNDC